MKLSVDNSSSKSDSKSTVQNVDVMKVMTGVLRELPKPGVLQNIVGLAGQDYTFEFTNSGKVLKSVFIFADVNFTGTTPTTAPTDTQVELAIRQVAIESGSYQHKFENRTLSYSALASLVLKGTMGVKDHSSGLTIGFSNPTVVAASTYYNGYWLIDGPFGGNGTYRITITQDNLSTIFSALSPTAVTGFFGIIPIWTEDTNRQYTVNGRYNYNIQLVPSGNARSIVLFNDQSSGNAIEWNTLANSVVLGGENYTSVALNLLQFMVASTVGLGFTNPFTGSDSSIIYAETENVQPYSATINQLENIVVFSKE
jgi:hypothetical protein